MGAASAGYGERRITPRDNNHYLAGYIMRDKPMVGVHDDIYARALVLEAVWKPLVIIELDILCIDRGIYMDIRRIADKVLGENNLVVAASHTHSAPSTLYRDPLHRIGKGEFRRDYYDYVLEMIREALEDAVNTLSPVHAWTASAEISGVATDRNMPGNKIDREAVILGLETPENRVLVIDYPVHPTVLGPDNLHVTRDLVGFLQDALEEMTGYKTMYLNGAAANISTRFTRREQSFREAERLGRLAADQIIKAIKTGRRSEVSIEDMVVYTDKYVLRAKKREDIAGLAALIETSLKLKLKDTMDPRKRRALEAQLEAVKAIKEFAGLLKDREGLEVVLTAINIDDKLGIVTWPGEIHSEATLRLRRIPGYREIMLIGYTNEYIGYLVPDNKGEITYESLMQILEQGAFEEAISIMRDMLIHALTPESDGENIE